MRTCSRAHLTGPIEATALPKCFISPHDVMRSKSWQIILSVPGAAARSRICRASCQHKQYLKDVSIGGHTHRMTTLSRIRLTLIEVRVYPPWRPYHQACPPRTPLPPSDCPDTPTLLSGLRPAQARTFQLRTQRPRAEICTLSKSTIDEFMCRPPRRLCHTEPIFREDFPCLSRQGPRTHIEFGGVPYELNKLVSWVIPGTAGALPAM
eukprot:8452754-Pyramimonas_sp.AAC.1